MNLSYSRQPPPPPPPRSVDPPLTGVVRIVRAHFGQGNKHTKYTFTGFSLAEILVLAGTASAGRMAPPASTSISARLKRVQRHISPVNMAHGIFLTGRRVRIVNAALV